MKLIQGGRGDGGRVNGSDPSRKISVETTMTSAGPTSTASNNKNEGLHLRVFLKNLRISLFADLLSANSFIHI